jgi:hypothetical protein
MNGKEISMYLRFQAMNIQRVKLILLDRLFLALPSMSFLSVPQPGIFDHPSLAREILD